MQDNNSTYENLWFDPAHEVEYRVYATNESTITIKRIYPTFYSVPLISHFYQSNNFEIVPNKRYRVINRLSKDSYVSDPVINIIFLKKINNSFEIIETKTVARSETLDGYAPKGAQYIRFTCRCGSTSYIDNCNFYLGSILYENNEIISLRREDGIFTSDTDEIKLGQVIIGQLELSLITESKDYIPRGAMLVVYIRLVNSEQNSSWYPQGYYYVSTRSYDKETGVLTIHAFDILRKSEVEMYTDEGDQGNWPMSDINAVNTIAARLGVSVDSRTTALMDQGYMIQYPGYKSGPDVEHDDVYYTMREVLGFIGAMYGGSWIISDEGKLRLIQFLDIPSAGNGYLINERNNRIIFGNNAILV